MLGQLSGISSECQSLESGKRIDEGHILVATPQALVNSLLKKSRRVVNFSRLQMVAMDEADALFLDEVQGANL